MLEFLKANKGKKYSAREIANTKLDWSMGSISLALSKLRKWGLVKSRLAKVNLTRTERVYWV